jgi:hypothetical protein
MFSQMEQGMTLVLVVAVAATDDFRPTARHDSFSIPTVAE